MFVYHRTHVPRMAAFTVPLVVAAWLVAVPSVVAASTFVACVVLITAVGWIVQKTHADAQPAASLAQSLHDSDRIIGGMQQGNR
jgi:hypothetical protein